MVSQESNKHLPTKGVSGHIKAKVAKKTVARKITGGKGGMLGDRISKSERADIKFPVARVHRFLRKGHYAKRISVGASVYLSAILEYLSAELLELSGNAAKENKRHSIKPRHLSLAIMQDEELEKLVGKVTISQGGVMPNIHPVLLQKSATFAFSPKGREVTGNNSYTEKK